MVSKYDTGQIVYVPVRIDKAYQAQGRLLYTIKHRDYEFEDPILENDLIEEDGRLILESPKPIDISLFFK